MRMWAIGLWPEGPLRVLIAVRRRYSGGRARTYGEGRWGAASRSASTRTARVPPASSRMGTGGCRSAAECRHVAHRGGYYYGSAAVGVGAALLVLPPHHCAPPPFPNRHTDTLRSAPSRTVPLLVRCRVALLRAPAIAQRIVRARKTAASLAIRSQTHGSRPRRTIGNAHTAATARASTAGTPSPTTPTTRAWPSHAYGHDGPHGTATAMTNLCPSQL